MSISETSLKRMRAKGRPDPSLPWYETAKAFRKNARLRETAKTIDEELHYRFIGYPAALFPPKSYRFPRTDYGKVSWDTSWGKFSFRHPHYIDGPKYENEGHVVPASSLALPPLPDDAVPQHVAHLLDYPSIEEIDVGFELFGGVGHETQVYFLQAMFSGLVKIGIASNVAGRVASIQSGSPEPIVFIHSIPANKYFERFLHGLFEPVRSHGEWFYPHWSIYAVIDGLLG